MGRFHAPRRKTYYYIQASVKIQINYRGTNAL